MRKRTVNHFFDSLLWYIIYLLPFIIVFLSFPYTAVTNLGSFSFSVFFDLLNSILSELQLSSGVVYNSLFSIFGSNGFIPFFNNDVLILYFSYFINCLILHVFIDFLAFIPRLSHTLLEHFCKE